MSDFLSFGTAQVDRLSSLPEELLEYIFDLAHTLDCPSTGALSKRLLPFHISGLYRRIHLGKLANFGQLIRKVSRGRDYGERIRSLKIDRRLQRPIPTYSFPWDDVGPFFQSLSRLEDLDLAGDNFNRVGYAINILAVLGATSIFDFGIVMPSVVALRVQEGFDFWPLPTFPSLVRLEYVQFNEPSYEASDPRDNLVLPNLRYLSFTGNHADHPPIAAFCAMCPNLRHLRLSMSEYESDYEQLVSLLPATLVSLELESDKHCSTYPCDDLLPRFTQLERLSLDQGEFSPKLPLYLASLSHLKELRLGEGQFSIDQFLPLVSGPTRLPSFHKLTFDYQLWLEIGYRIEVDDDGSIGGRWVPGEGRLAARDWILPAFDFDDRVTDGFTPSRIRELIQVVRRAGVEVDGNISRALEVADAYLLEVANLAVYRSFRDGDLTHIAALKGRGPTLRGRLPSLDLDALDPKNLELVKTDLPDEGWFQLSLRNKGSE
ncbi:hypothetical protein JCM11491_006082 [Sporobolomyces phaffii]